MTRIRAVVALVPWLIIGVGCDDSRRSAVADDLRQLAEVRDALESARARNGDYPSTLDELVRMGLLSEEKLLNKTIARNAKPLRLSYRRPSPESKSDLIIVWMPTGDRKSTEPVGVLRLNGSVQSMPAEDAVKELQQ